ncbi:MAG TPA: glycosyltransferase family 2 protein [Chloroflexota bacterium]|nr:glycosyltransferase family 2 protein [Chloroflexota bacterium]
MKASIIIPTYNRADVLLLCLTAVSQLKTDPSLFETIVVDNASTDHTKDISLYFAQMHPHLSVRYTFEGRQGVSYARNHGVLEAQGEIICLLDDDSPPTPEWLNALLEPFSDPQVGCVGGPSMLDYQGQPVPPWLQGDLKMHLSAYRLPYVETTQVSRWEYYPLSCNMAIRRSLFAELGYFRTDLDRSGDHALAAGDTEMADRIHSAGRKVLYVPNALVNHLVYPDRLTKDYVYHIGRGLAETHVLLTYDRNPLQIIRWFLSDAWYATRMFFWLILAVLQRKPLWFDDYMRFWMVAQRLPVRFIRLFKKRNRNPQVRELSPENSLSN